MASARRVLTYTMALVGLFSALYGASHLLGLFLANMLLQGSPPVSGGDVRQELSLYLATILVGLPLWLSAAAAAQHRARRAVEERDARERRLYLAVVFTVTSVVALFEARSLLSVLFAVPAAPGQTPDWQSAVAAGSQVLVYGAAWLCHARAGWAERPPRAADPAHDLAVSVLAGSALACLVYALFQAVQRLVDFLVGSGNLGTIDWVAWSDIAAWALAGAAVWCAIWSYDLRRGGRRTIRVLYLYLVLWLAVPGTLWGGAYGLYEVLRRLFGYHAAPDFLRYVVPTVVIGSAVWVYHWSVVRAQASPAIGTPQAAGSIAWPRRPGVALLVLLGHAIAVPGTISLLWLALDALFNNGVQGPGWWRDRLCAGLAAVLIGGCAWLWAWAVLQRAANASPAIERTAKARRLLLGTIVLTNAISTAGFAIALLWLLLRALLGEQLDSGAFSSALKYLSTAVILSGVTAAHALQLRADLKETVLGTELPRLQALVAADASEALIALRSSCERPIEVLGQLSALDELPGLIELPLLQLTIATLGTVEQEGCDSVLLLVRTDGGTMLRYTSAGAKRNTPVES